MKINTLPIKLRTMLVAIIALSTIVTLSVFALAQNRDASAANASDFSPGNIISDAVFYNGTAMTATQIQSFLNAKNTQCDTNGTGMAVEWGRPDISRATLASYIRNGTNGYTRDTAFHAPPYVCLKDFRQNTPQMPAASGLCGGISAYSNRTAAQMISDVARACGINPQVLLVLLQKEQSLVTDIWPLQRQYRGATGFACPDTAPCDPKYNGFFYQVYYAARQFKIYQAYPNSYNYVSGRTNKIYWQTNLGEFINPTGNQNDPSRSGRTACGYENVYIQNQATAALYIYTPYQPNQRAMANLYGTGDGCSAYGNRNFWRMFTDWFGSPAQSLATDCDSRLADIVCVWSVRKNDGSQFLTTSKDELKKAVYEYGWISEGIVFYAHNNSEPGANPVYRLRKGGQHYFTSNAAEYSSLKTSGLWVDEGIRFYSLPASSSNSSHSVYKLYDASNNRYYWLRDSAKKADLLNQGYTQVGKSWNTPTALLKLPQPPLGRDNIYQLKSQKTHLYTTNLAELESAVLKYNYRYEGVLSFANEDNIGTPVYRLQHGGKFFYTTSAQERDAAIKSLGYLSDGVRFYIDGKTPRIYSMYNTLKGNYAYTTAIKTVMSMVNTNGWTYHGTLNDKTTALQPVFRFINVSNYKHFYTLDANEAFNITNRKWKYEGVAFHASPDTGKPVYRLYGKGEHFYTTSATERDAAVKKYGYVYQGIRFYLPSQQ